MARGRPANQMTPRRAQVLTYWRKHGPCTLGQLMRACGFSERSAARKVLMGLLASGHIDSCHEDAPESAKKGGRPTRVAEDDVGALRAA